MNEPVSDRVERRAFEVSSLFDQSSEKRYWLAQTPYARLRAVELMRQMIYGYRPSATRLQRFFEIAQRESSWASGNRRLCGRLPRLSTCYSW